MKASPMMRVQFAAVMSALALVLAVSPGVASARRVHRAAKAAAVACDPGTDVQIDSGSICGIVTNGVDEWLGIPYAALPVGALRWQPPHPPTPWTSTLAATAFGNECAQNFPPFPSGGTEDCLYLNVWRPAGSDTGLPVMVHIHGGGFVIGSGNGDNTLLATTGHEVIVSMNYRLGIFGFWRTGSWGRTRAITGCRISRRRCGGCRRTSRGLAVIPTT
jgi:acetyl esterase/lipase